MIHIQPYTGLQAEGSEVFYLDPRTHNGRNVTSSRIGLRYQLLPPSRTEIVRRIDFFTNLTVGVPKFATNGVLTIANARAYMLTLVSPSGEVIVNGIPITRFCSQTAGGFKQQRPMYFDRTLLVDPRQSYLECTVSGLTALVPFQLTYAR